MLRSRKTALDKHREHQRRRGIVRVEIQVPREDVARVRGLASMLRGSDSTQAEQARQALVTALKPRNSAKELLATMPDEIPLDARTSMTLLSSR